MTTADPYTAAARLCDDDGIVRSGGMHHGTDYPCTGHAHYAGEHYRCTSPAHAANRLRLDPDNPSAYIDTDGMRAVNADTVTALRQRDRITVERDMARADLATVIAERDERLTLAESSRLARRIDEAEQQRDEALARLDGEAWDRITAERDQHRKLLLDTAEVLGMAPGDRWNSIPTAARLIRAEHDRLRRALDRLNAELNGLGRG